MQACIAVNDKNNTRESCITSLLKTNITNDTLEVTQAQWDVGTQNLFNSKLIEVAKSNTTKYIAAVSIFTMISFLILGLSGLFGYLVSNTIYFKLYVGYTVLLYLGIKSVEVTYDYNSKEM